MQGWKLLAREGQGDRIQQCPEGHIHLDYGNFSIRFQPDEFLAFARWVGMAAVNLSANSPSSLPKHRVLAQVSKN